LTDSSSASPTGLFASMRLQLNAMLTTLMGEERPRDMLILLSILVLLLHIWGLLWLLRPIETPPVTAQPLLMAVSMVSVASPKPNIAPAPPAPPTPPRPPEKTPTPKKPQPKPIPRVVQKPQDLTPAEKTVEQTSAPQSSPTSTATDSAPVAAPVAEELTEANYRASYLHNPAPEYPSIAKSRGWQGRVKLLVQVSAEGLSEKITIEKSSGHDMLDEAAIETVKKYKFIPAKRGQTPIASTVIVPIDFHFEE